jgi:hypothetical protein
MNDKKKKSEREYIDEHNGETVVENEEYVIRAYSGMPIVVEPATIGIVVNDGDVMLALEAEVTKNGRDVCPDDTPNGALVVISLMSHNAEKIVGTILNSMMTKDHVLEIMDAAGAYIESDREAKVMERRMDELRTLLDEVAEEPTLASASDSDLDVLRKLLATFGDGS